MKKTIMIILLAAFMIFPRVCFANSAWAPFNGTYTKGDCSDPEYTFIVSEGLYLYILKNGAKLSQPVDIFQKGKYLLQKWSQKEKSVWISYNWLDKDGYHTTGRSFMESTAPMLSEMAEIPPKDWKTGFRQRCPKINSEAAFIHAEGISFMKTYRDIYSSCQKGNSLNCLNSAFQAIDVSNDRRLSKAEICRMIRIITYIGVLADSNSGRENEKIAGSVGIAALVGPFIASSIIGGSDYDGDGQLSMDELFLDRDIANVQIAMKNMSFDVAVSSIGSLFRGFSSALGLFR